MFGNLEIAIGPRGWTFALFVLFAWLFGLNVGCVSAPRAMADEFGTTAKQFATSVNDQAVWKKIAGNVRGHVNNPGIRTEAGVAYFAEVRLLGTDGDVELGAEGEGNGELSEEARAVILKLAKDYNVSPEEARLLIRELKSPAPAPAPASQPVNKSDNVENMVKVNPQ